MRKTEYHYRKGIAGTGIIGSIEGLNKGERIIAVRAEMDALPITEANQSDFTSLNTGKMHACGHDAHMAMAYGNGKAIKQYEG